MDTGPSSLKRFTKQFVELLVERTTLRKHLALFSFIVFLTAVIFTALTQFGHGLASNGEALTDANFWQGLYLSIATVSTLGYSDLHPIGISKFFATIEVLYGLTFFGIVISKITSRRLTEQVQRLFEADAKRRLDEFSERLESLNSTLRELLQGVGRLFPRTPGESSDTIRERRQIIVRFHSNVNDINITITSIYKYTSSEAQKNVDLYTIVPPEVFIRLGNSIDEALHTLGQLICGVPYDTRIDMLELQTRKIIFQFRGMVKKICDITSSHASDNEVRSCFARVSDRCERLKDQDLAIPPERPVDQPNQTDVCSDDPIE